MPDWREVVAQVEQDVEASVMLNSLLVEREFLLRLLEGYKLMAESVEGIPADGYCPVCAAQPWMDHLQDNGHGEGCPVGSILDHLRGGAE